MPVELRNLLFALTLGLYPGLIQAESGNRYATWYQVEIIIFALINPVEDDEKWPATDLSYPAEMVRIGPVFDETRSPTSLSQLQQILAHKELLGNDEANPGSSTAQVAEYLFSTRSRFKVVPAVRKIAAGDNGGPGQPASDGLNINGQPADDSARKLQKAAVLERLFNPETPHAYRAMPIEEHVMNPLARSINRSRLYRLLWHEAWLQPVVTEDKTIPILIQVGKHYDDQYEVDGTISISRSRFLHVNTNLVYTKFTSKYQQRPIPITLDIAPEVAKKYPQVIEWESERRRFLPLSSHKLQQSRRMRSSTLHYIDHPYFGILMRVEKFHYQPKAEMPD